MARPRKVTDEEVFAAAGRLMAVLSPTQLKLSDIAAEAGVTAGALVQRFGSKRNLLLTLVGLWSESIGDMFRALSAGHPSPLDALRTYAEGMAQMGEGPGGFAHHLGWLQLDLGDPAFHEHARRGAQSTRRELSALLGEAIADGELDPRTDPIALARAVEVTISGSLLTWAFHKEGSARSFMRDALAATLEPYLTPAGRLVVTAD